MLVNGEAQGVELVMLDKIAQLKSYNNKKKKSLISDFLKYSDRVEIGGKKFLLAKPDLAILEMLYNSSALLKSYSDELIKKRMKKNKKNFDFELIE